MKFSGKKLLLIGFVVILLVGIPLTVFILQQQTNVQQHAQASTNLAFSPDSSATAPIQKNVGDTIPLDVTVDPGKNLVSFVKLEIQYDPTVLATASANAFQANVNAFPSVLEGPVYSPGKIAVTLSVGNDPTKVIQTKATAATITFTALKSTPPGTPTLVTFTTNTEVLSTGPSDQASENVLSSATPATIAIGAGGGPSPTSPIPSGNPVPTNSGVPTSTPAPTNIPAPTLAPTSSGGGGGGNGSPVCTSLTTDVGNSGTAPFTVTFTASGSATGSNTISKVSFNFGDGQVSDVTQSGGIGTASVNAQAPHTYNTPGTFQASATLTDSSNNVSSGGCSQSITVSAAGSTPGVTNTNPTPTMPATGSTGVAVGIGLGAILLILGGGLLFFVL